MPGEAPRPDVLAMILADAVHKDSLTGKCTILGTFNVLCVPRFPGTVAPFVVYLVLTEGRGKVGLELRLIDVDEERPPVFSSKSVVTFPDPLAVIDVPVRVQNVRFPSPGEYRLQLLTSSGELLRERRLRLEIGRGLARD